MSLEITSYQYEALSGLKGAINRDAEDALGERPEYFTALQRIFQRITEIGQSEKPIRTPEKLSVLAEVAGVDPKNLDWIIEPFVQRDLLVIRRPLRDEPWLDLPHECLAWKWQRLHQWIEEEARVGNSLRFFRDSAEKRQWITGSALVEALQLQADGRLAGPWAQRYVSDSDLEAMNQWVSASEKREQQERIRLKRQLILASSIVLILAVLISAVGLLWHRANRQKQDATSLELAARAANELWLSPSSSSKDVREALKNSNTDQARKALDDVLAQSNVLKVLKDPDFAPVSAAVFARDKHLIMSSTFWGKLRLWDLVAGKVQSFPISGSYRISVGSLSSDGRYLLAAIWDRQLHGLVQIFDTTTGGRVGAFVASDVGPIESAVFSRGDKFIATTGQDYTAAIWNARKVMNSVSAAGDSISSGLQPLKSRRLHGDIVNSIRFSEDDKYVVTASQDGRATVWDWQSDRFQTLRGYSTALFSAEFYPKDYHFVMTGGQDGHVKIWKWDMHEPAPAGPERDHAWHKLDVKQASYSFSGDWKVAASYDGTATVWKDDGVRYILFGQRGALTGADFSPSGNCVMTSSVDGTIRIWTSNPVPNLESLDQKIHYLEDPARGNGSSSFIEHNCW